MYMKKEFQNVQVKVKWVFILLAGKKALYVCIFFVCVKRNEQNLANQRKREAG